MPRKVETKKTVQSVLNEKGIINGTQAMALLIGKTITMPANTGYGTKGTKIRIDGSWLVAPQCGPGQNGYIYQSSGGAFYFSNMTMSEQTVKGLEEEMKANLEEIAEIMEANEVISSQISFMKENDLEEYDEDLHKTFEVLKSLDNKKLSGLERAKVIASIIKR